MILIKKSRLAVFAAAFIVLSHSVWAQEEHVDAAPAVVPTPVTETAAVIAPAADAESPASFTIRGGIDFVVVPIQRVSRHRLLDDGNVFWGAGMGRGTPDAGMRTRAVLQGTYGDIAGFRTDLWFMYQGDFEGAHNPDSIDLRIGDIAALWWQPAPWVRLELGRVFNASLVGYVHDHWLSAWQGGMFDGGNIFSHFWSPSGGVLAQFTPARMNFNMPEWTNNLSVFVFVPDFGMPFVNNQYENPWLFDGILTPGGNTLNSNEPGNRNDQRAMRVFQRTRVAIGYKEEGLFHARLQFAGANPRGFITRNRINELGVVVPVYSYQYRIGLSAPSLNAAFAWLGTPNLVFDVGVRSWLPVSNWITDTWSEDLDTNAYIRLTDTGTYWGGIGFGVGMSYSGFMNGSLTFNARLDGGFLRGWRGTLDGMDAVIRNPMQLSAHIWPRFTLPNGHSVMFSAGVNYLGRNFVERGGENLNDREGFRSGWERSDRLRMGAGLAFEMPIFRGGWVNIGLAYRHGTRESHGGEANVISLPIMFFFNW